jgi:hypothetical protein
MSTDAERRELYDALATTLGARPADTLMSGLLFPGDRAELARQSDLMALRGDFTQLRGEFAELRGEFAELRGEVRAMGFRLDAQLSKLVAANAVTAVAVAGLAFAAARVAG